MMAASSPSLFQIWINAISKPNEQTFATIAASPKAKASTAYLWVFIGGLIQFFFAFLVQGSKTQSLLDQSGLGQNLPQGGVGSTIVQLICGAPILAVIGVVFFAIGAAIVHWIAKMFGGKGTFDQLAYSFAAILTPAYLVSAVLSLLGAVPIVGLCFSVISVLFGIYIIVLQIMAVKGVEAVSWGGAVGSVLIPFVVVVLICGCLVIASLMVLGPIIGNTFSSINQSLLNP
jgi:hypothetical protein